MLWLKRVASWLDHRWSKLDLDEIGGIEALQRLTPQQIARAIEGLTYLYAPESGREIFPKVFVRKFEWED
jgi:hypothetical protein